MRHPRPSPLLLLAGLAASLGACAPDRVVTGSTYPVEYRQRHPIVLAHEPDSLDVFVSGGVDERQQADVAAFAAEYRRHGQGLMTADIPSGPRAGAAARHALPAVRAALAQAGVPAHRLVVTSYPVVDPNLAAPIRLSFKRLQAKVASRCGLWPQDLGMSNAKSSANNEPYWNLGCAMQTNIAAQVEDPVDLVRGRTETRIDTIRRMGDIEKLRQGQDPSTQYSKEAGKINDTLN